MGQALRSDALHGNRPGRPPDCRISGLALVIDLRESDERASAPERPRRHRPPRGPPAVSGSGLGSRGATFTAEDLDLGRLYAWMLGEHGAALTDAVRLIGRFGCRSGPLCTALQERTAPPGDRSDPCRRSASTTGDIAADYAMSELMLAASGWTR
ncbi:hypothetical protein GS432_19720 [Rhodococcus hoagii]|nr:hypothetical protein [Prescottella equi]